jgi:hypothetical protein
MFLKRGILVMRRTEIRLDKITVHANQSSLNLESHGCIEPVCRPLTLRFEATTLFSSLKCFRRIEDEMAALEVTPGRGAEKGDWIRA